MIAATNIRTAIDELLKGTIGKVRTVTPGTFTSGYQPWHGQILVEPRYDIKVGEMTQHAASPVSGLASFRIEKVTVEINFLHHLKSPVVETERDAVRETVALHADTAMQALHFAGNLRATAAGALTGIASGLLDDLSWSIITEDWDASPARVSSRIRGTAAVRISQAVT